MRQHVVSMFGHREILHTHTLFGPEILEEDETACSVYVWTQGKYYTHTHSVWTRDTRG